MRRCLVLVLLAGALVLPGKAVWACSCAATTDEDLPRRVREADAAFLGTEREPIAHMQQGDVVRLRFSVERVYKAELGRDEIVRTSRDTAGCGIGQPSPGRRTGLLLYRRDGEWTSHLCSMVEPEQMMRVLGPGRAPVDTTPTPPPTATLPPRTASPPAVPVSPVAVTPEPMPPLVATAEPSPPASRPTSSTGAVAGAGVGLALLGSGAALAWRRRRL